ncbi:putative beta-D-xylosidase 7 [Canna indica]|uniref:Beta-D-xylosidase 7 n=1 Tax=Canna indica TaxID=4628 RepID=A0AAQ3L3H1_9LILI|nr:putative beta-D-xylosidase 7 [Canna indica]
MRTERELHVLSYFNALLLLLLLPPFLVSPLTPPFACDPANSSIQKLDFCKTTLPIDKRVDDLISRLTLQEKTPQLGDIAPAIPRLGIPAYKWWSEALHGVSSWGRGIHFNGTIHSATNFPQVILTAASFNPQLWYRIGQAIGIEARAIYNMGQAEGLTFWSPNVNIFRDPRWGRGQETPGEDPTTASKYAVSFVRGLQGDSFSGGRSPQLKTSACCKHYTAYDLDNWKGNVRYTFDARVTDQDMEDTYQPPFRSCVKEGQASCIMCSYNRVNGVPTCADYNLLSKTTRGLWGFDGYIASDCDSVALIYGADGYAKSAEEAVADVLQAGMDMNCGDYVQKYAISAVQEKKLSENDINRALHNLFSLRMRLGFFNGNPIYQDLGNISANQVCSKEHQDLALEAARDGIVLLKNRAIVLPLSRSKVRSIGVVGPNANIGYKLLGNYGGPPCEVITPLDALKSYVSNTRHVAGCATTACASTSINEAVKLARSVDYVIIFMGLDQDLEREDLDRVDLVLPGKQQRLISSVARAARRPIILVLLCGGPVDITFAKSDRRIGAILWAGYPGEAGGLAISQIIFGDHNPGGRLPVTWYPQEFTTVPMTDMRMRADPSSGYPGRTYRFYTGKPVYRFGYGLSYSTYSYEFKAKAGSRIYLNSSMSLQKTTSDNQSYEIKSLGSIACRKLKFSAVVSVKNHGPMAGKHPVLLFSRWPTVEHGRPMKQLIGFKNVHLEAGQRINLMFSLRACEHLSRAQSDGTKVLDKGSHFLIVGEKEHEVNIIS